MHIHVVDSSTRTGIDSIKIYIRKSKRATCTISYNLQSLAKGRKEIFVTAVTVTTIVFLNGHVFFPFPCFHEKSSSFGFFGRCGSLHVRITVIILTPIAAVRVKRF